MKLIAFIFSIFFCQFLFGQSSLTTLRVNGDVDKFYPVVFRDLNWVAHQSTEIHIGRADTHEDRPLNGSVMAKFKIHLMGWGHGSYFIETDIYQTTLNPFEVRPFVAGYHDATVASGKLEFVIWLRGASTYHYYSNCPQSPAVYDNVQKTLPYQEENGSAFSFKTTVDSYVNSRGPAWSGVLSVQGGGNNYFAGNVGIGTLNPQDKLSVKGKIRAEEIRVTTSTTDWPDYVFRPGYQLPSLSDTEKFIQANGHLPEVPKAAEVAANGVQLGEMNKILLKKIEELTLQAIADEKIRSRQQELIEQQSKAILNLEQRLGRLETMKSNNK